jgi:hypothetical protein
MNKCGECESFIKDDGELRRDRFGDECCSLCGASMEYASEDDEACDDFKEAK